MFQCDFFGKTIFSEHLEKENMVFRAVLNVPEDDIECEPFIVISIDSLLVYDNKYYLQVYLDNCAYKTVNKQMKDYLGKDLFED